MRDTYRHAGPETSTGQSARELLSPRLWYLIPARVAALSLLVLLIPYFVLDATVLGGGVVVLNYLAAAVLAVAGTLYLVSFLAVVALYAERSRLSGAAWRPAWWYYVIAVPGSIVGLAFAALYTYRRVSRVGVAAKPQKL